MLNPDSNYYLPDYYSKKDCKTWMKLIAGMGTHMLENTLQTRCTDLGFTVLQMGIDMKDHGTKEEDKGLVCILSEMARPNPATGKMAFLISGAHIVQHNQYHPLPFTIPEFLTWSR